MNDEGWGSPEADVIGDLRRAVEWMRDASYEPARPIFPSWMLEWPGRLMFTGYHDVLDRTRPWPRVVLFPRLARFELHAEMWRKRPLMQLEKLALHHRRYRLAEWLRDHG